LAKRREPTDVWAGKMADAESLVNYETSRVPSLLDT